MAPRPGRRLCSPRLPKLTTAQRAVLGCLLAAAVLALPADTRSTGRAALGHSGHSSQGKDEATAGRPGPALGFLAPGRYLGPAREKAISFLVLLRSAQRPECTERWASRHGLRLLWYQHQDWAVVTGAPAAVAQAFAVSIGDYRSPNGMALFASDHPAAVPPTGCGEIEGVGAIRSAVLPKGDDVPGGMLSGVELMRAYDATPLANRGDLGQGETVVFVETDGYSATDLARFAKVEGLTKYGYNISLIGKDLSPGDEATMDMETVHEIAPKARLVYLNLLTVAGPNASPATSFATAFQKAAAEYPGAIFSVSLGICETWASFWDASDLVSLSDAIMSAETTSSQRSTVFASSGDSGGLDCTPTSPQDESGMPPQPSFEGVEVPAVLPAVTGVGGTTLGTYSNGGYAGEAAWDEPLLSQGSGGGVSVVRLANGALAFPRPSWQTGIGTGGWQDWDGGRQVPDVSADADPSTGNLVVLGGQPQPGGGTSLATPIWAGFMALVDEYLGSHVGFLNPLLYRVAATGRYPAFHDITVGGNDFYSAGPGYDMVTGLGTPDVWNLARDLRAAGQR
jgi:kumamolisin